MDFVIIHGSPGTGKTTIAQTLHEKLGCPWFEFGWIPEFNQKNPHTRISQKEEEQMSFENLTLVCKNYAAHGYQNVILTDLDDRRMLDVPQVFRGYQYLIVALYSESDAVIKERILTRSNGNEFRDWEQAILINKLVKSRKLLPNECRIRTDNQSPDNIAESIRQLLTTHEQDDAFCGSDYSRKDYFTYIKGSSEED